MKRGLAFVLIILALFAGALAVSCGGGDGDEEEPVAAETREAADAEEETPEAKPTKAEDGDKEDGEGEPLAGVPIYPGAKRVSSGEWSGSEMPIPMVGAPTDPEDYGKVTFAMYEVDDPPSDVFEWYKDKMGDWKEEWTFSGGDEDTGEAGVGVWTKDGGKTAAWVMVSEDDEVTSLVIATGTQ
ncbi:MAG: hypothetical protein QME71_05275 [Dehalococcoidia bacterium]|nr:hypothetical protein [Dehalococcoidia bacterium]